MKQFDCLLSKILWDVNHNTMNLTTAHKHIRDNMIELIESIIPNKIDVNLTDKFTDNYIKEFTGYNNCINEIENKLEELKND